MKKFILIFLALMLCVLFLANGLSFSFYDRAEYPSLMGNAGIFNFFSNITSFISEKVAWAYEGIFGSMSKRYFGYDGTSDFFDGFLSYWCFTANDDVKYYFGSLTKIGIPASAFVYIGCDNPNVVGVSIVYHNETAFEVTPISSLSDIQSFDMGYNLSSMRTWGNYKEFRSATVDEVYKVLGLHGGSSGKF